MNDNFSFTTVTASITLCIIMPPSLHLRARRSVALLSSLFILASASYATDLQVRMTASSSEVPVGTEFTYTIVVDNTSTTGGGPYDSPNTVLRNNFPDGLEIITVETTGGTCATSGQEVECDLGTVTAGSTVTVTVTVRATTSGQHTSTATAGGDEFDPNTSNNATSVTVTATAAPPDLSITKSSDKTSVAPGEEVTFTLTVVNNGGGTAHAVQVEDIHPLNLYWNTSATTKGSCSATTCSIGDLEPGESVTVTMKFFFDPISTQPSFLRNQAAVTTSDTDANAEDNETEISIEVEPFTDLSVTKQANTDRAAIGDTVTYTITVENSTVNDVEATNTTVSDVLPEGTEYVSHTTDRGSCTYAAAAHTLECDLGDVPDPGTVVITVKVVIRSTTEFAIDNHVGVSSGIHETDPFDNEDIISVAVDPHVDIAVTKTAEPMSVAPGDVITYTIVVTNQGNDTAENVVVSDPGQLNVPVQSITSTKGSCDRFDHRCTVGSLERGESATITIVAQFNPISTQPPFIHNTATATTSSADINSENDRSTVFVEVQPFTDLSVTKTVSSETAVHGDTITYTITVDNFSLNDVGATNTTVSDALPQGVGYVSHTTSRGSCSYAQGAHTLECDLGTVPDNETVTITVKVVVNVLLSTLVNRAGVNTGVHDTHPDNDVGEATTSVDSFGQVDRDDAANSAIGVAGDVCPDPNAAWIAITGDPLPPGTEVASHDASEYSVTLTAESWVGYVNCYPYAKYEHDGAVVVLSTDGSSTETAEIDWWVEIDGEPMVEEGLLVQGTVEEPQEVTIDHTISNQAIPVQQTRVCALLVSGEGKDAQEQKAFNEDVRLMEVNLTQERLGPRLSTENVRKLENPTEAELVAVLNGMRDQYDTIYFYYSGHGSEFGPSLRESTGLWITIAPALLGTNAPKIEIIIDACESGGAIPRFRDSLPSGSTQDVNIVTSSTAENSSWTHTVLTSEQTGSEPVKLSFFSWHFALCFGDPAADRDGDGKTTVTEAFNWVRNRNPVLRGKPITELMDPQIVRIHNVPANQPEIAPAGADLRIRPSQPFNEEARFTIETRKGLTETQTNDSRVEEISTGRYWSIDLSGQTTPFTADLIFDFNPEVDFFNSSGIPGLVTRPGAGMNWMAHLPSIWDPAASTVTAVDVDHFSDWAFALVEGASAVAAEEPEEVPVSYALHTNYPNPFNPSTTITFDIPDASHVELAVYDGIGRRISTLVSSQLAPGRHKIEFDATGLPTGVYTYVLTAEGFTDRRAMVLVR